MNIKADFYNQWITNIKAKLTQRFGSNNMPNYSNPHEYAIDWESWNRRLLSQTPRKLQKATAFQCPTGCTSGLALLENAIVCGSDLSPWLSKTIRSLDYEDAMLNDWGIHHLHLGKNKTPNGFIERTEELLFAVFNNTACFEIGVYQHGDWSELDLLEVINSNWPGLIEVRKLKGIIDISHNPKTRAEILTLRKANVCYMLKLSDGSIIMPPGGGVMTDGTSSEAVMSANDWGRVFNNAEKQIKDIIQESVNQGKLPDENYEFILNVNNLEIKAIDNTHNIKFNIWKRNA